MKILQLCKKFPYPLKDGESIAVTYLSKALVNQGCEVTLLSMNTSKHYTSMESLPEDYDHYKNIYQTSLDNAIKPHKAFLNLFTRDSYHVSRFVSSDFKAQLIEVLKSESFDVVQLETLYLTPYIETIKEHSNAIIAMRSHNIEFEIWERITSNTRFLPKKWYLKHLTDKLKKYELERLNDYDYLVAVSDRDLKKFKQLGYKNGAMASPIGLELKNYVTISKKSSNAICFIGALDWRPNREGLDWFIANVWPELSKEQPDLKFHIAGRNTPADLLNLNIKNIVVHGEVNDAIDFISQHNIMIVPLFSGSGMRVKILEGMALRKTIVTTSLGKEGIDAEHQKELLIADDPQTFKNAIIMALHDQNMRENIGKSAQQFVSEYYDHATIAARLIEKYKQLISTPYQKH
ncbi:MAG: glycosyltransferase [Saprospiraceae bacterium]|nr:glycosyltransferase [Saprospiraceae bacterium]